MARTLQDLINATQGGKSVGPREPNPFGRAAGGPVQGAGAGAGMPYGIPLSPGALGDPVSGPNPFAAMGNYKSPPQVMQGGPMVGPSGRAPGPVAVSAPNPFEAYGGAFGGVNQNDLYRKNTAPAAGPNGMMGPAPNLDFNAMAQSQNSGLGAQKAASKPWEGVFNDAWRTSTDSEFRQMEGARQRGQGGLFGKPPSGDSSWWREPYNAETGVSLGYGPGRGVYGFYEPSGPVDPKEERMMNSKSDEELRAYVAEGGPNAMFDDDKGVNAAKAVLARRQQEAGAGRRQK